MSNITPEEYWQGSDINIETYKKANDEHRDAFYHKIEDNLDQMVLISFKFKQPSKKLPLLEHELLYKAFKKSFHDFKKQHYLNDSQGYFNSLPLFLYKVDRGSAWYEIIVNGGLALGFVVSISPGLIQLIKLADQAHQFTHNIKMRKLQEEHQSLLNKKLKDEGSESDSYSINIAANIILNMEIEEIQIRDIESDE